MVWNPNIIWSEELLQALSQAVFEVIKILTGKHQSPFEQFISILFFYKF